MNLGAILQIREFDAEVGDYELIETWFRGHGREAPPQAILPKLGIVMFYTEGIIRDDVAAVWLYMDNSVGVCFAEHAVTKPGLPLSMSAEILRQAIGFLRERAAAMDYGVMICHTVPGFARYLETHNWHRDRGGLVSMVTLTR